MNVEAQHLMRKYQEVTSLTEVTISNLLEQKQFSFVRNYLGDLITLQEKLLENVEQSFEKIIKNAAANEQIHGHCQFRQSIIVDYDSASTVSDADIIVQTTSKDTLIKKQVETRDANKRIPSSRKRPRIPDTGEEVHPHLSTKTTRKKKVESKSKVNNKPSGDRAVKCTVWTTEEDELLLSLVKKSRQESQPKFWREIAEKLNRSKAACVLHHYFLTKSQM